MTGKPIPNWLTSYLKAEDLVALKEAVAHLETTTDVEVVPMVAQYSIEPRPYAWTLRIFAVFSAFGAWELLINNSWDLPLPNWFFLLVFLALGWSLSVWLFHTPAFLRLLVSKSDMTKSVHEKAELEFYRARIYKTERNTGFLIFVSLLERKAVILADTGLMEKLPNFNWDLHLGELLAHLKERHLKDGIVAVLKSTQPILATNFPPRARNPNEITNDLRILAP